MGSQNEVLTGRSHNLFFRLGESHTQNRNERYRLKSDSPAKSLLAFGTAAFFCAAAGVYLLILVYRNTPGLSRQVYFLVAFALGISAAAILFGGMKKAEAHYVGQHWLRGLRLSGPPVVFFAVIGAAYVFAPAEQWLDLDVYLRAETGTLIDKGKVIIHNDSGCNQTEGVNPDERRAVFKHLAVACGGPVVVETNVEDYEPKKREYVISGNNTSLTVDMRLVVPACELQGRLIDPGKQHTPVANARVKAPQVPDVFSDETGTFKMTLPLKCGSDTPLVILTRRGREYDKAHVPVEGAGSIQQIVLTE